jgi:hypothetical protein
MPETLTFARMTNDLKDCIAMAPGQRGFDAVRVARRASAERIARWLGPDAYSLISGSRLIGSAAEECTSWITVRKNFFRIGGADSRRRSRSLQAILQDLPSSAHRRPAGTS